MDSKDFGLSGSYASMSRPGAGSSAGFDPKTGVSFQGRDRATTQANKQKPREKKEFYAYDAGKFTSIPGDASAGEIEEDEFLN